MIEASVPLMCNSDPDEDSGAVGGVKLDVLVTEPLIKEISDLKGDISKFVHPIVEQALRAKLDT